MDDLVEGAKSFAAVLEMSVAMVREEMATYPDPLPAWRLRRGRLWSRRSQLLKWRARHPLDERGRRSDDVVHPLPGLAVVRGRQRIGKTLRGLRPWRVSQLLPWAQPVVADPIPAWRDVGGVVCAYRDALLDWLERQSTAASSPRFQRRWPSKLVTAKKSERKMAPETTGARSEREAARVPRTCQEGSKGTAQKVKAAA